MGIKKGRKPKKETKVVKATKVVVDPNVGGDLSFQDVSKVMDALRPKDQVNKGLAPMVSSVNRTTSTVDVLHGNSRVIPGELPLVDHPFDLDFIVKLFENSNSLRQNIDAYAANIDSHGHRFVPTFILDSDNVDEQILTNLSLEKGENVFETTSKEQLSDIKKNLEQEFMIERLALEMFFTNVARDDSFIELRVQTRHDYELTGNAYWEVVRDMGGRISQVVKPRPQTMFHTEQDAEFTRVEELVSVSKLSKTKRDTFRRYRRFVEVIEGSHTYFKEFGDPRVVSRKTGRAFESKEDLVEAEDHDLQANELLHFRLYNSRSTYGVPRWIGAFLALLGSRYAEQVNVMYFNNKSVPPLVITISGGKLTEDSTRQVKQYIEHDIKGIQNFNKALILEAEPAEFTSSGAGNTGVAKIDIRPLTQAINNDALFQNYDKENIHKIGQAFRLPPLLRGDSRDFNRACYDDLTETLTENGWKYLSDLTVEERIAAYNPKSDALEYVFPKDLLVYDVVDEDMLHFINKNIDCLVTPNHTMLVRPSGTYPDFTSHRADSIPWKGYSIKSFASNDVVMEEVGLRPGEAEVIGMYLALGKLTSAGEIFIKGDLPTLTRLSETLSANKIQHHINAHPRYVQSLLVTDTELLEKVAQGSICSTLSKMSSCDAREMLYTIENKTKKALPFTFRRSDKDLVNALQIAAIHAGRTTALSVENNGIYRLLIGPGKHRSLHQEPTKVKYTGKVYCFNVPDHGFFVTRRNGKVTIQGNTASAVLKFTEQQIFASNRRSFDDVINRTLVPSIGAKYHKFVSNSPATTDPIDQATMVQILSKTGALTPRDLRVIIEEILNIDLKMVRDQPWLDAPYVFATTVPGSTFVTTPDGKPAASMNAPDLGPKVGEQAEDEEADEDDKAEKDETTKLLSKMVSADPEELEIEVRKVPAEIWKSFGISLDDNE